MERLEGKTVDSVHGDASLGWTVPSWASFCGKWNSKEEKLGLRHTLSCRGVCVCVCVSLSCGWLFATPRTAALQALLSMGFSRQDYWSGLPFPSPEDLPDPGIEPWSPALQADSLPFELLRSPLNCKDPPICDAQQVSFWPLTGNLGPTWLSASL